MGLPLWFPDVRRVPQIDRAGAVTIERLCELAQTPCRASGAWTQRPVVLHVLPPGQEPWLRAEDPPYGAVEMGVPALGGNAVKQARWALGCLAYSALLDPVARAFADEVAALCRRHGFAIGTLDPLDELVIEPLSDEAVHALRHARPRR